MTTTEEVSWNPLDPGFVADPYPHYGKLRDDDPVRYGITRELDTGSFWNLHFGEFRALGRDLRTARSVRDRLAVLLMPPGWSPDGSGRTVADAKRELVASEAGYSSRNATKAATRP